MANCIALRAASVLVLSGNCMLPTAKLTPSTSAAVMVMVTCKPIKSMLREWFTGLSGKRTEKGASLLFTSRQFQ